MDGIRQRKHLPCNVRCSRVGPCPVLCGAVVKLVSMSIPINTATKVCAATGKTGGEVDSWIGRWMNGGTGG